MTRYIDAILLAYTYLEVAKEDGLTGLRFLTPEDVASKILELSEEIDEVAPVVHARWIAGNNPGFYYCSNCDGAAANTVEWAQKYCFHCGARMDEEQT